MIIVISNKMKKVYSVAIAIVIGNIVGALWYRYGERFDQKTLSPKCWEILHYHNKERFSLHVVHIKSILAGVALIVAACSSWKFKTEFIVALAAAIIGLHIYQWHNEMSAIKANA